MVRQIISTVVLILFGGASFTFGMISCATTNNEQERQTQHQEQPRQTEQTHGEISSEAEHGETEGTSAAVRGFAGSLLIPNLSADRGQQKALAGKSDQILSVWEILKTANGAVNILISAHTAGSESLSPLNDIMGKLSNKFSFAFSLILFFKILMMLTHYMVFLALIPICVLIIIIVIWTSKEKKSAFRLILISAIIAVAVAAALPVSFLLSSVIEEKILAHDITSLLESINEKGDAAKALERNVSSARSGSITNNISTARNLGNGIVADVTNYYIIFSFLYIVIPILILLFFIFLSIYFVRLIKNR